MALETVTHISDLNPLNPTSGDPKSEGDNHVRNIKSALKTTFANITGAVTASHVELNLLAGKTSIATQADINAAQFSTALPAQAGNAGKFVTTDGTNASWTDVNTTPFSNNTALAQVQAMALCF